MRYPINHVIDADIKSFFDRVNHAWLLRCLRERIRDEKLLRYIVRFLKAGVMEAGNRYSTDQGTPQGGIISPILANIYLHYVLDLWVEKRIKRNYRGQVMLVRYADDSVLLCKVSSFFVL
jgi:retron-type reverse transcriptase